MNLINYVNFTAGSYIMFVSLSQRSNVETLSPKGMASRDEAFGGQLGWIRSWRWRVYGRNTCLKGHGVSLLSSLCVSLSFPHCSKEGHVSAYRRKTHQKPTVLPPWIFSNAGPHPHKAVLHRWATSQPLVFETWSHCTSQAGLKLVTIDFHSLVVNMDPQDYVNFVKSICHRVTVPSSQW